MFSNRNLMSSANSPFMRSVSKSLRCAILIHIVPLYLYFMKSQVFFFKLSLLTMVLGIAWSIVWYKYFFDRKLFSFDLLPLAATSMSCSTIVQYFFDIKECSMRSIYIPVIIMSIMLSTVLLAQSPLVVQKDIVIWNVKRHIRN